MPKANLLYVQNSIHNSSSAPMKTAAPSAPFASAVIEDLMAFFNFYVGFFM
jgi:hypothetical protein